MTTLLLARHGQTAWNKDKRFRGRADVPLDGVGLAEAEALAGACKDVPIDAVYASPLQRCIQTAKPTAEAKGLDVRVIDGLADIDFGEWQGKSKEQVEQESPELYRLWIDHPEKVKFPGGESLEDVRNRAEPAVRKIVDLHRGGVVLAVTHRVVCKVLICTFLDAPLSSFWRIRQDAACLNELFLGGDYPVMIGLNRTSHTEAVPGSGKLADF